MPYRTYRKYHADSQVSGAGPCCRLDVLANQDTISGENAAYKWAHNSVTCWKIIFVLQPLGSNSVGRQWLQCVPFHHCTSPRITLEDNDNFVELGRLRTLRGRPFHTVNFNDSYKRSYCCNITDILSMVLSSVVTTLTLFTTLESACLIRFIFLF